MARKQAKRPASGTIEDPQPAIEPRPSPLILRADPALMPHAIKLLDILANVDSQLRAKATAQTVKEHFVSGDHVEPLAS